VAQAERPVRKEPFGGDNQKEEVVELRVGRFDAREKPANLPFL
jgi:hypothetical protein